MSEKLREHLAFSVDTDMGEKKPVSYSNVRNRNFVNLHGIAAIELSDFKDFTLFYENGRAYAIPLRYASKDQNVSVTDDEHVTV